MSRGSSHRGGIQRKTWCMGPYAGFDYSLIVCRLLESTLTLSQSRLYPPVRDLGLGLWTLVSTEKATPPPHISTLVLYTWRKMEQPYSPNLSDLAECVILCTSWLQSPGKVYCWAVNIWEMLVELRVPILCALARHQLSIYCIKELFGRNYRHLASVN